MNSGTTITYLNHPIFSDNPSNKVKNEARLRIVPQMEEYLKKHARFNGKSISVSFFHAGASGLVCLLDTIEEKYVLKVLLRQDMPEWEPQFLQAWEVVGVIVPHVYEYGLIGENPFLLMQYVPAKSLENYSEAELLEKRIFERMGAILRTIHTTKAQGFGKPKELGVGEYPEFKTWLLENPQTINQLSYIQKHNLLPEEQFGSVEKAKEILIEYIASDPRSTYCHWDFTPGNILFTSPLTVFDPVPMHNHPYLDIARSIMQTIGAGYAGAEVSSQFISGYFSEGGKCDAKVLHAAILFTCHTKIPYWHKTGEEKILENLNAYLVSRKHLMD